MLYTECVGMYIIVFGLFWRFLLIRIVTDGSTETSQACRPRTCWKLEAFMAAFWLDPAKKTQEISLCLSGKVCNKKKRLSKSSLLLFLKSIAEEKFNFPLKFYPLNLKANRKWQEILIIYYIEPSRWFMVQLSEADSDLFTANEVFPWNYVHQNFPVPKKIWQKIQKSFYYSDKNKTNAVLTVEGEHK